MNRLTATLLVLAMSAGNAYGQSQTSGRVGSPQVRVAQNPVVPARSSSVPRPARPVSRSVSQSLLSQGEVDQVVYDEGSEPVVLGESYDPNQGLAEIGGGCTSCGGEGCDSCATGCVSSCGNPLGFDLCNPGGFDGRQLCICLPSHGWVSVEYLMWYQSGMETPALVTTSPVPTAQNQAGVLPLATTLYGGNNDILSDRMNGTRVRFGWWFANNPNLGIEAEYFGFGTKTENFDRQSTGDPILARPFYNAITGMEDSELVAFPNLLSGRIRTEATSKLDSAAVRFRRLLCCSSGCGISPISCGPVPSQSRIDATLGWRFYQLKESLTMREDLTSLSTNNPGSFIINDSFRTRNQFNGAELGMHWMGRRGYWSLDMLMRLGIGNTRQEVVIGGTTQTTQGANVTNANGGLLAQRTNSGTFTRDQFGMVPELGATLGYQLTQHLRFTAGYTFIYWSNVVRPGDQIDTTVNPNLLPPENPTQTAFLNPRFAFQDSDYWIQGLSLGGEYRW
ncbi:MAG: BBP7 family outer membrane beta-barrel protein [Pirellula sp.]